MTANLTEITNEPRPYAWGTVDGVARVLGKPATGEREAELWLGAHPGSPSRSAAVDVVDDGRGWHDLAEWERRSGVRVPYLLKILCAAGPLSIQAHPTPEQAREGFEREERLGVPRDAAFRNYKDPNAKPELIVALADGFEALCGFRPLDETLAVLDELAPLVTELIADAAPALAAWRATLAEAPDARAAFDWALSGADEVSVLVDGLAAVSAGRPRFELIERLATAYPSDPGVLVALMMHHLVLRAGECVWMPAGNVHAYLRGDGVELMGPSDNVLRGGLTPKHIDVAELGRVLDFSAGGPSLLEPIDVAPGVVSYRPALLASGRGVPFELLLSTGDTELELAGPSIAIATDGDWVLRTGDSDEPGEPGEPGAADAVSTELATPRGTAVFVDGDAALTAVGSGRLFLATSFTAERSEIR